MVRYSEKLASVNCHDLLHILQFQYVLNSIPDTTLLCEFTMDKVIFLCWKSVLLIIVTFQVIINGIP